MIIHAATRDRRSVVRQALVLLLFTAVGVAGAQQEQFPQEGAGWPGGIFSDSATPSALNRYEGPPQYPGTYVHPSTRPSPLRITSSIEVTTTSDTGAGSLRAAIDSANKLPGVTVIAFNIPGGGVHTITPLSPLPAITSPVIVDGTTQPGYDGAPLIELNGTQAGTPAPGLILHGGGNTVRGLIINRFSTSAIVSENAGGDVIRSNYLGVDASGTVALGNSGNGVFVNAPNDTIGGLDTTARNIISGNALPGIYISSLGSRTIVQGNYIGTDVTGTQDLGNLQNGVNIEGAPNTIIGDTSASGRNVIGGNDYPGIYIIGITAFNTLVEGNYIGTDATGSVALGDGNGIVIDDAFNNTVGGPAPGARNVLSGNPFPAVFIKNGASGNIVVNNYIGTDPTGLSAVPNSAGITIDNSPGNRIGGASPEERNIISGNSSYGIQVRNAGATGNSIVGNFIGTDVSGSGNLGNGWHGVILNSSRDSVTFNRIGFNNGAGVYDSSGTGGFIVGNSIFSNAGLGIDLAPEGLTINDSLDLDSGPNGLINFPLLDSATVSASTITVHGRYQGAPNTEFELNFYSNSVVDSSHFGEGETYLSAGYTGFTDASGNATFDAEFPFSSTDHFITATARDTNGNTSEFTQNLCLSDSDGDGIMDSWETKGWGIDVNSDGRIDLDLYALGARPDHKDLFVEVDAMTGFVPPDSALIHVQQSFAAVPNVYVNNPDGQRGIAFHYVLDDTTIPALDFPNTWDDFDNIKLNYFGTYTERTSANGANILAAKTLVYRYCIFARTFGTGADTNCSGLSELGNGLGGNDFMVTFGSTGAYGWNATKDVDENAGTFMHELGHSLGLHHGGDQDANYKPNYYSVMNYTWQTPRTDRQKPGTWRLDYSEAALPTLYESSLNEPAGLNPPPGIFPIVPMPYTDSAGAVKFARLEPGSPVDWNGNGDSTQNPVNVDINLVGDTTSTPGDTLTGYADWSNLKYNFRNSPNFKPGTHLSPPRVRFAPLNIAVPEITKQIYDYLHDNIPLPKPAGRFHMDGLLDTSAVLLTSNAGINLYARYNSEQLYVATNSAQSQNADMFIFISDNENALRAAPAGKAGSVAGWAAFLFNKSADNSIGWYDNNGTPLPYITVDTTGNVLEGVIDIGYLFGQRPPALYIAVGKYGPNNGDTLLAQVPAGNGDRNIDPSEFYLFTDSALPIQLSAFTAQPGPDGKGVLVNWTTASEISCYGFDVQRSYGVTGTYQTVLNSFIPGHGTTNQQHTYTYMDSTVTPGKWYYRIQQTDLDGTHHYSDAVAVSVLTSASLQSLPDRFGLDQNYPNPFNPTTVVRYQLPAVSTVQLIIYDLLGREVTTLVNGVQEAGYRSVRWDARNVASGVYFYRLVARSVTGNTVFTSMKKMLVIK